jgi:hypothetical protein
MLRFKEWLTEQPVDEGLTSSLYKAARLSADVSAVSRSIDNGTLEPIIHRLFNKVITKKALARIWK